MPNSPELSALHELASFAEAIAARARAFTDDVEVLVLRRDLVSFALENRALMPELKLGRLAVGLRALKGGKLAVAATTSPSVDENVAALRAALAAGRASRVSAFSGHRLALSTRGFDESLGRFTREPGALQELAADVRNRAFAAAEGRPHVESIEGRVLAQTRWLALATGKGAGASLENALQVSVDVNAARSENEVVRAWPADESLLREVGARGVREFPAARVTPEELGLGPAAPVPSVLSPELVEALFRYPAHDKFLASSLVSGQSALKGGEALADARITLHDTGRPAELARDFDDELVPRGHTALIERGRFGGYVTSRASALASGRPETGNGARYPILAEETTEAPVRDRLLGLSMEPGSRKLAELVSCMERGLIVRGLLGIHGADRARTAFSATVADGLAVRDGKVIGQLAPGRWNVSGRVLPGDGERGLLQLAEPSLERVFTGSALVPHLAVTLVTG
ncbi:MAG: metallopeptidase TldD-related protein [Myxococcaceae bacterium]